MEFLPPRIDDPASLSLLGEILAASPSGATSGALRLRLMQPGFSWQALIDLADAQGVLPALVFQLKARALLPPMPKAIAETQRRSFVTSRLEAAYRQHSARQSDLREHLGAILAALGSTGISVLLLKGARYLVAPIAPWCDARGMRDIDLLVRGENALRAVRVLESLGYVADRDSTPLDHHLPEMRRAGAPASVEIHTEALAFTGRAILSTDDVWARGLPAKDAPCVILPPEWHLLHDLIHHQVSDHGYARRTLAIKPLWEFAWIARELTQETWRSVGAHLEARNAVDILASWLIQAEQLFGLERPAGVPISSAARAQAEATLRLATAPNLVRRARFLADQLRFGFARETMAMRYGIAPAQVSVAHSLAHSAFLLKRYRGRLLSRLLGHGHHVL